MTTIRVFFFPELRHIFLIFEKGKGRPPPSPPSSASGFYKCFKGNVQFIFLCNPQKSSVNVCFMKILKSTIKKISNYVL